jgi:formylglycine-generating enzyme required for sulfatase activity
MDFYIINEDGTAMRVGYGTDAVNFRWRSEAKGILMIPLSGGEPENYAFYQNKYLLSPGLDNPTMILMYVPKIHDLSNIIDMEFMLIPAGKFTTQYQNDSGNSTEAAITISTPFFMGKYEVTQKQWVAVMGDGSNPANFEGWTNPVENVSWDDVQEFITRLNKMEGHNRYRLPTEAEWEYAARAGRKTTYFFGDSANSMSQYAWFDLNALKSTHPVGQKKPNPWGLYDIYGNVREWVQDGYSGEYYGNTPDSSTDPVVSSGSSRVNRGGCWSSLAENLRSVDRGYDSPDSRLPNLGFRLVLSTE